MRRDLEDDGLFLHSVKQHSLEKIERHDFYATVFARAMEKKWPKRVYIGLYAGPGRARLERSGEIIETSAMGALRAPYTHYIFVDRDEQCTAALKSRADELGLSERIVLLTGDVNDLIPAVKRSIPRHGPGRGVITFCFIDPYSAALRFNTIRELAAGDRKIDFLILLMLGRDIRTNFQRYFEDEEDSRIAELIDDPHWRDEFRSSGDEVVPFLLRKFDEAMTGLDYLECNKDLVHQVRIARKNVLLYSLVLYSRHELGQRFWRETLRGTDPQLGIQF